MGRPAGPPGDEPWARIIRESRQITGLSQADVAGLVGISAAYMSRIEKGTRKPSKKLAESIAGALGIPPHQLARAAGYMDPQEQWRFIEMPTFEQVIGRDQRLTPRKRRALSELYELLVSERAECSVG